MILIENNSTSFRDMRGCERNDHRCWTCSYKRKLLMWQEDFFDGKEQNTCEQPCNLTSNKAHIVPKQ